LKSTAASGRLFFFLPGDFRASPKLHIFVQEKAALQDKKGLMIGWN